MTDLRTRCQFRLLLLLVLLMPLFARADVVDAVNAVRRGGCAGQAGGTAPLRRSAQLDEVARHLSQGAPLRAAQQQAHYHAVSSFSVSISAVPASGDVNHIIAGSFCAPSTNPVFREIGVWRRASQVWIAFAQPFTPPVAADQAAIARQVLALVNTARAQPRRCGAESFAATPPLRASAVLERAALAYAQEMAAHGYMDHTGRDGSSPAQRVSRSGYRWVETGENLASGVMGAAEVVDGWVHSPGHCANLMSAAFSEMGVGFAVNPGDDAGVYWALEFGRPFAR